MLETVDVRVWKKKPLRSTLVVSSDELADCQDAQKVVVFVRNGLDQSVDIQLVGNDTRQPNDTIPLGAWSTCDANSKLAINMDVSIWLPYMGVQVRTLTQATTGDLSVSLFIQREKLPVSVV